MARSRRKSGGGGSPNKKLPLKQSIPLGIQHVLAMFAGNITVPIIVAGVFGSTTAEKIFLIQMALFAAGRLAYNNCMERVKLDYISKKGAAHISAQCKTFVLDKIFAN